MSGEPTEVKANSPIADDEKELRETHYYSKRKSKAVETTYRLRVLCGRANEALAEDICKMLHQKKTPCRVDQFANGEVSIKVEQNVRGDDVFIIQPTCANEDGVDINTSLMELLLLVHTLRLASAKRITAIVPYFAYARQDRKTRPRVPISASCVAQLLQGMGVDRVITVDLHCGQIQGFFYNTPVDNLPVTAEWARYIQKVHHTPTPSTTIFPTTIPCCSNRHFFSHIHFINPTPQRVVEKEGITDCAEELTIVSPDAGGVERAMQLADKVQAKSVVTILKRRVEAGKIERMEMVGDVKGQVVVIVDDICDTGGTLCKACVLLKEKGAKAVYACITHGILTHPCLDRMNDCDALTEVVTTNSLYVQFCKNSKKKFTPK